MSPRQCGCLAAFLLPTPPLAPAPLNERPWLFILRPVGGARGAPSPRGPHTPFVPSALPLSSPSSSWAQDEGVGADLLGPGSTLRGPLVQMLKSVASPARSFSLGATERRPTGAGSPLRCPHVRDECAARRETRSSHVSELPGGDPGAHLPRGAGFPSSLRRAAEDGQMK